jgi:hypothetical protein
MVCVLRSRLIPHDGGRTLPLPYPFGSVADQLGAGLLIHGGNTDVAVTRNDQGPNPSCWSLDPLRRMSQMLKTNPNKTGFDVSS